MPSVNVGESEFALVATAANVALERGDKEGATALDKLARKINAALTNAEGWARVRGTMMQNVRSSLTWRDVPSVISTPAGHGPGDQK